MRKVFNILGSMLLTIAVSTSSGWIYGKLSINYYDDRTATQLQDANLILNNKLNLNSHKHVLLIGLDGIPYSNLPNEMINNSKFKSNYYIQNYETIKGWTSVLWGNILKKEQTIFKLIKNNNDNLKVANIAQSMEPYFYDNIYDKNDSIDYNNNFFGTDTIYNFNTQEKINNQLKKLLAITKQKIDENYNFIFMYNLFYDSLKHKKYDDNNPIIWMGYTLLDTNYVDKWTN